MSRPHGMWSMGGGLDGSAAHDAWLMLARNHTVNGGR